ncbi:methionine/alanine import family NSS transporter small subunit [Streptomyces sp. XM4193]|uniref:methionine/alanine import family NSS transporter small subunit n=1 Tax=Streptomyces sp. XM4193 TaxID=2929782 RepID=UPI001FF963C3|nr:methionine/alanine import family NSS transporter small subunit [Streptomyces sp. XM4193]MCK1796273.1 methionine/alanine import family NSS transporter small subunit [Streptomyces sp. XM4193]
MGASAIMMMVFAILLLWGGMVAAILKLRSHPEEPEPDEEPGGTGHDGPQGSDGPQGYDGPKGYGAHPRP